MCLICFILYQEKPMLKSEESIVAKYLKEKWIKMVEFEEINWLLQYAKAYTKDCVNEYRWLKVWETYWKRTIELIKPDWLIHWRDRFWTWCCSYNRFCFICTIPKEWKRKPQKIK